MTQTSRCAKLDRQRLFAAAMVDRRSDDKKIFLRMDDVTNSFVRYGSFVRYHMN
jgi:hypothetical protein